MSYHQYRDCNAQKAEDYGLAMNQVLLSCGMDGPYSASFDMTTEITLMLTSKSIETSAYFEAQLMPVKFNRLSVGMSYQYLSLMQS